MTITYMTEEGLRKLKDELVHLESVQRLSLIHIFSQGTVTSFISSPANIKAPFSTAIKIGSLSRRSRSISPAIRRIAA